jgi:hypothetical protein
MKTIFSFFISCLATISVIAQTASTVKINVRGANNDKLVVDGKTYIVTNDNNNANTGVSVPITITDLQYGQHTLQIIRSDDVNSNNTTYFNLRSGYDLNIIVLANGSVQLRETKWVNNTPGTTGNYGVPMADADFTALYKTVNNQWRNTTRVTLVNDAFENPSNFFTTAQAKQLIGLINSQSSRLSLAKASYRSITDPNSFSDLYSVLNSQAHRNELTAYVNNYNSNNTANTGAMSTAKFNTLYRLTQNQNSTTARVSYLTEVFNNDINYFSSTQVRQLIQLVSGESYRLQLAKLSYKRVADPANFSTVHSVLTSQASRNQLTAYVNAYNRNNSISTGTATAMSDADFNLIYRDVQGRFGLGAKMAKLRSIFDSEVNYFTVAQAKQLIQLVSSEANRLELAKSAYNDIVDPVNFSLIYDVLASQSSRAELDTYVRNNYDYKGSQSPVYTTERTPMTDANFNTMYNDVSNRWGLGVKMSALTDIFNNETNYFTVVQAKQLVQLVSDESNRLQLAKSAYGNITDPQNFNLMYDVFSSQTRKNELAAYVNSYSYNR